MFAVIDWDKTGKKAPNSLRYSVINSDALGSIDEDAVVDESPVYLEAKLKADELNHSDNRGNPARKSKDPNKWAHFVPGALGTWTKDKSHIARKRLLNALVNKVGYATVIRRLNQLANVTQDYKTTKLARKDMLSLMKQHRPEAYKDHAKEFQHITQQLLYDKKKSDKKVGNPNFINNKGNHVDTKKYTRVNIPKDSYDSKEKLTAAVLKEVGPGHKRHWTKIIDGLWKKHVQELKARKNPMELMVVNPKISDQAEKKYKEFYHGKEPETVKEINIPDWKEAIDGGRAVEVGYVCDKQASGTQKAGKTPFVHQIKDKNARILIHPSGKAAMIIGKTLKISDWWRG